MRLLESNLQDILKNHLGISIIAVVFIGLAFFYMLTIPLYEASDELWHYPMVKYMADNSLALPPQDPQNPGPWRQQGSQPPLYYMMGAVLTGGIDTSDMNFIRRVNLHSDIGIVRPDGNANMMVHRTEAEQFPWTGTVLATYMVRIMSIVLATGTVIVTYLMALRLFPDKQWLAISSAGFTAFLPMFVFISSTVSNDNLSNLTGNALVLILLTLLAKESPPHWRWHMLVGVVTGAGILAKLSIGFLIPLVAITYLILSWRFKDWRIVLVGGVISGGLTILIAGWWYWHNFQLYGDPTGLDRFLDMVGRRPVEADLTQLWNERDSFLNAFWGFFGGMNVPMDSNIYMGLNIIGGIGLLGAIAYLVLRRWRYESNSGTGLMMIISSGWILVTFISYLQWTAITIASQGRLVFGALSSISIWLIIGMTWWLPEKWQSRVAYGVVGIIFAVAVSAPITTIAPAYALPSQIEINNEFDVIFSETDANGAIGMLNAQVTTGSVMLAEYIHMEMDLSVIEPLTRDWSIFVHLVSPDGVIIGQRDVSPGQGRLATSDLDAERTWHNTVSVFVPLNAYTPMTLDVMLGWYHLPTGARLQMDDGAELYNIGQVELVGRESEYGVPNPISIQFDDIIELVGYELTDLSPEVGDNIELTLYWRALREIERDYVVFANIIDPISLTKYADSNAMPANWTRPTTTWELGEIITDTHTLTVRDDSAPGIYEIEVGMYIQEDDGSFNRLKVIQTSNNFIHLTRVRIIESDGE